MRAGLVLGLIVAAGLPVWPVAGQQAPRAVETIPGMPPVVDAANLYSETRPDKLSPAVARALPRVYVPNLKSNDVYVIDPATLKVVDRFRVGINPQHIVPSYDLKTLWVTNNAEGRTDGSLTPIDPATGKPGKSVAVDDPYNMYFTPDGRSASWSRRRSSGSTSAIPRPWRSRARSRCHSAPGSIMRISPSTGAS